MGSLRFIFGDQLSHSISSLEGLDPSSDTVLICESSDEMTHVKHHRKKIAFQIAAMRHFARELESLGINIKYIRLEDPHNTGSIPGEIERSMRGRNCDLIIVTQPSEYRLLKEVQQWQKKFGVPVEIREDNRFLCSRGDFEQWLKNRKQPRMEHFYREMRKKYHVLMEGSKPVGDKWNYDLENRKVPDSSVKVPTTYHGDVDHETKAIISLVGNRFPDHFGEIEPFHYAVTRQQALAALDLFIEQRLKQFGDYQDAMLEGQPWMYHAHISLYLNIGLLLPMECIEAAETAFNEGKAPLNAVEGFIRQVMGWREFVRGIYWAAMPRLASENFLHAKRSLPSFFWTADTKMNCLKQCVLETRENAYAHHIQRLMVLGNFALLTGISPEEVNEWFLIVYADAYQWVELPNVSGMALFADGGYLASKPYSASGTYINKMSNYCDNCSFQVKKKSGAEACPFNYLYWDFLARNREKLSSNHRLGMIYRTYDRMSEEKKGDIKRDSQSFLEAIS